MKKIIIGTLFTVLATTNAVAGLDINDDYSKAEIKSSVQDDTVDDDAFFACTESDCLAPILVEEDWATYLNRHSGKIAAVVIAATVVAGGIYYLPIYLSGTAATSLVGKGYYALFAMAGYAPKVVEVYVGGGAVEVPGPTQYVGVHTHAAWREAMNQAARHYDYKAAFTRNGKSLQHLFTDDNWDKFKTMAEGYLNSGGDGLLGHSGK